MTRCDNCFIRCEMRFQTQERGKKRIYIGTSKYNNEPRAFAFNRVRSRGHNNGQYNIVI